MYKTYKEQEVRESVKVGFDSLTGLARARLKTRWKKMSLKEKCAAARALVYMQQVAKNPDAYFSRKATEDAWHQRAVEYAKDKKIAYLRDAYYIVQDPTGVVCDNASSAFFDANGRNYYNFCKSVQQWMYDMRSNIYATQIVEDANKYKKEYEIKSANCFMRPIVAFGQSFQR
ncbi:MAG: hypothetical protein J6R99_01130 [Alphaproteobacteria bacterium]|nr:hypothetical protein [Alphaproteobacteria bacterium]